MPSGSNALRDQFKLTLFAFDYRGYGRSEGQPNEAGILLDAGRHDAGWPIGQAWPNATSYSWANRWAAG